MRGLLGLAALAALLGCEGAGSPLGTDVPDEALEDLPTGVLPGLLMLVTSAHPLSMGPSAFWYLQVQSRASAPAGLVLTSQTLHLGPVQTALPSIQ